MVTTEEGYTVGAVGMGGYTVVEWSHQLVFLQRPGLPRLAEGEQVSTWSLNETLMAKTSCSSALLLRLRTGPVPRHFLGEQCYISSLRKEYF